MLGVLLDIFAIAVLMLGLLLATIGIYGLLRMRDIRHQLHAAGLVTGPSVVLILLASLGTGNAEIITSATLVILFILITSPLASHAIARTARRRHPDEPPPGRDE